MHENIIVYVLLCVAFLAICVAAYLAIKLRMQRQNEEKHRLAEEEKLKAEIAEKTEKFIRLSSRYFGNMIVTEKEKQDFFYGVLADEECDALIVWLDLMGMLEDTFTLEKMIVDERFRINLTLSEYKELYDHIYGPGAYAVEISEEIKKEIEKYAWLSFRDKPERQKVVESRALAQRFSQEEKEEFLDKKAQYKFNDLDSVRKAFALKLKELTDFMFKIFPIFNDAIDRLKKTEANLFENIEFFRLARKEADDYHKHLLTFTDPRELEKNIKDIVSKAVVEAMKKGWENEAKLREESIKKAVENGLKPVKEETNKHATAIEHFEKLVEELIESVGQQQAEKLKKETVSIQVSNHPSAITDRWPSFKQFLFGVICWFAAVIFVLVAHDYYISDKSEATNLVVPAGVVSENELLSDLELEFLQSDFDLEFFSELTLEEEIPPMTEKPEEVASSELSEPAIVELPKNKSRDKGACTDKQCCVERFGGKTETWPQAVICFREIEKK